MARADYDVVMLPEGAAILWRISLIPPVLVTHSAGSGGSSRWCWLLIPPALLAHPSDADYRHYVDIPVGCQPIVRHSLWLYIACKPSVIQISSQGFPCLQLHDDIEHALPCCESEQTVCLVVCPPVDESSANVYLLRLLVEIGHDGEVVGVGLIAAFRSVYA